MAVQPQTIRINRIVRIEVVRAKAVAEAVVEVDRPEVAVVRPEVEVVRQKAAAVAEAVRQRVEAEAAVAPQPVEVSELIRRITSNQYRDSFYISKFLIEL